MAVKSPEPKKKQGRCRRLEARLDDSSHGKRAGSVVDLVVCLARLEVALIDGELCGDHGRSSGR